jgi:endonuclease G
MLPSLVRPARRLAALALATAAACTPHADRPTAPASTTKDATYPAGPNLWIVEVMADPAAVADASGEWIKLYNPGPLPVDLQGLRVLSATGTQVYTGGTNVESHTIATSIVVPVGQCVVIGNNVNSATNGNVTEAYSYGTSITLGNNNTDWVQVKTSAGVQLDSVAYSTSTVNGTTRTIGTPAYSVRAGISRVVIDPSIDHTVMAGTNWQDTPAGTTYGANGGGDRGTPNTCQFTQRVTPGGGPVVVVTATATPSSIPNGSTTTLAASMTVDGTATSPDSVTWAVSPAGIVTLAATTGTSVTATATAAGSATATATAWLQGTAYQGTAGITVTSTDINWIDVSSSSTSFPAGFQTQLFATARVSQGGTIIPATFLFESLDPAIATVQNVNNTAIITGVSGSTTRPGIKITATPVAGGPSYSFVSRTITIEDDVLAPTTIYANNVALGLPSAASSATPNDFLIQRTQYTLSYNQSRGTPNWVSYELDARQMLTGADRCNCFSADPLLPPSAQILTSDYTSGGYDRGHMARSADRIQANGDNARTFYMTNIVPQLADLNQGVWASFENALADSARTSGKAVYIVTGPFYIPGKPLVTLKGDGKVAIPDSTWKVAMIVPRKADGTPYALADLGTWPVMDSVTVLAVMMPNVSGIRNDPWQKYLRTVDQVEALTGLDMLSLLSLNFQNALEAGDRAPVAVSGGSTGGNEGQAQLFDASASSDPDFAVPGFNEALTFGWSFGDGTSATGPTVSKSFADNGNYLVTLVVTDRYGWPRLATRTVPVANVAPAPTVAPATGYTTTVKAGTTWAGVFRFTDPGLRDAPWRLAINWGDGTTFAVNSSSQAALTRGKVWTTPGTYTVTWTVTDKDGAAGTTSIAVTVTP